MIDYVFASIPLPDPGTTWQESIRSIGVAGMDALTAPTAGFAPAWKAYPMVWEESICHAW
jgi:hypothetical protein